MYVPDNSMQAPNRALQYRQMTGSERKKGVGIKIWTRIPSKFGEKEQSVSPEFHTCGIYFMHVTECLIQIKENYRNLHS